MRKRTFLASVAVGAAMALSPIATFAEGHLEKYNLLPGKPFEGTAG